MATIKDVAKKAGVSVAVVSKAFNNYKDISPETRKRILEIAKELNYSPNRIARKLSSKNTLQLVLFHQVLLKMIKKIITLLNYLKVFILEVKKKISIFLYILLILLSNTKLALCNIVANIISVEQFCKELDLMIHILKN